VSSGPDTQAAFELLRLSASRVSADIAVVEVEGRFARASGRFARRPQLVIETGDRRVQHDPVHREDLGGRWRGTYAVPADALESADSLALGIRGALLELPPPDVDEGDRFAALAREANALRRALEAAELDAAEAEGRLRERVDAAEYAAITARDEARAEAQRGREESAAELTRVREEADAELARVRELLARVGEELARVREEADASAAQLEQARGESEAELARGRQEAEERAAAAEQRAAAAEERSAALEIDAAAARDAQADERRRAEAAVADLQASLEQARADEPPTGDEPLATETQPITLASDRDGDDDDDGDEPTQAVPALGRRRRSEQPPPEGWVPIHREPSAARWVAVAALLLFFVVLLLLLGFL